MSFFAELRWSLLLSNTYCRICKGATITLDKKVSIKNCKIYLLPGSNLTIASGVKLQNCTISVSNNSTVTIGNNTIIGEKESNTLINVESGSISIGSSSKLSCRRIWVRFGGIVSIGNYTNINSGSEIRCDEKITIGNYNQISYNVNIWDTNTHCILPKEERQRITKRYFPYFGFENQRPQTKPVIIGNDCWLGQNSAVLKGSIISDEVIIGYNTLIAGKEIPPKATVINDVALKIINRNE